MGYWSIDLWTHNEDMRPFVDVLDCEFMCFLCISAFVAVHRYKQKKCQYKSASQFYKMRLRRSEK
jgi:peptidoglycan/LPS O-acetylase OafA/YrhL